MSEGLKALKEIETANLINNIKVKEGLFSNKLISYERVRGSKVFYRQIPIIEKELKALNEIVALHDKWLGNGMSDFEFFTLLNDIKYKYGLENEVLK